LLETIMALVLLAIVVMKAHGALSAASETSSRETQETVLEDQATRVLRQIAYAIMGSNRETLIPDTEAPLTAEDLRFQVNLGIQDGQVVWSDPEKVALEAVR
jgi:hypothetical protein